MSNTNDTTGRGAPSESNWYWSQRGTTLGPVDFAEIRRLVLAGSIAHDTWLFDPARTAWVQASSIGGLFATPSSFATSAAPAEASSVPPTSPASSVPPTSPSGSVVYCRFCGATNSPLHHRCASCGREAVLSGGISADPKLAAVFCRLSVLAAPLLSSIIIGPAIAPGIFWAIGRRDERVVAEAKETFNCLITLVIVLACATVFGLIGAILIVPPIIAAAVWIAASVYCVVTGIMGLVALSDGRPFRYPWIFRFIK